MQFSNDVVGFQTMLGLDNLKDKDLQALLSKDIGRYCLGYVKLNYKEARWSKVRR